jgi:hypothetical protein
MDTVSPLEFAVTLLALAVLAFFVLTFGRIAALERRLNALEGDAGAPEERDQVDPEDALVVAYGYLSELTRIFWNSRSDEQIAEIREASEPGTAVLDLPQFRAWLREIADSAWSEEV